MRPDVGALDLATRFGSARGPPRAGPLWVALKPRHRRACRFVPGMFPSQDLLHPVDPATNASLTTADASPTGRWLLRTSVDVLNGVLLEVKGTGTAGGDADEVRPGASGGCLSRAWRPHGLGLVGPDGRARDRRPRSCLPVVLRRLAPVASLRCL